MNNLPEKPKQIVGYGPLDKDALNQLASKLVQTAQGFVPFNGLSHPMKLAPQATVTGIVLGTRMTDSDYGPMRILLIQLFPKGVLGCEPLDSNVSYDMPNGLIVTASLDEFANYVERHIQSGESEPVIARITNKGMKQGDKGEYINYIVETLKY